LLPELYTISHSEIRPSTITPYYHYKTQFIHIIPLLP
jgi:hypothetical protein